MVSPPPGVSEGVSVPPIASVKPRAIASPHPSPSVAWSSSRWNGTQIRSRSVAGMPGPRSMPWSSACGGFPPPRGLGHRAARRPALESRRVQVEVASADQHDRPTRRPQRCPSPVSTVACGEPRRRCRGPAKAHQIMGPVGPLASGRVTGLPGLPVCRAVGGPPRAVQHRPPPLPTPSPARVRHDPFIVQVFESACWAGDLGGPNDAAAALCGRNCRSIQRTVLILTTSQP
jgi:hypothetical protein